ncbi:MAG: hypothetical protein KDD70_12160, partial [Bdellovibrionales bacterium]|nr:hypothetical protein [Bdellovibrionales bacterium]
MLSVQSDSGRFRSGQSEAGIATVEAAIGSAFLAILCSAIVAAVGLLFVELFQDTEIVISGGGTYTSQSSVSNSSCGTAIVDGVCLTWDDYFAQDQSSNSLTQGREGQSGRPTTSRPN